FEGFDAVGQRRTTENGVPVDTAAEMVLDGQLVSFSGPVELIDQLARSEEAHGCYASRWIEFAHGRPLALDDVPTWRALSDQSLPIADIVGRPGHEPAVHEPRPERRGGPMKRPALSAPPPRGPACPAT